MRCLYPRFLARIFFIAFIHLLAVFVAVTSVSLFVVLLQVVSVRFAYSVDLFLCFDDFFRHPCLFISFIEFEF